MISGLRFEVILDLQKSMGDFVHYGESSNYTTFLEYRPFRVFHHDCDTGSPGEVVTTHPGSIYLNIF